MAIQLPIYMDNHATTPVDPRVLEAMLPYFNAKFGNAASRSHAFGWTAEEAVELRARADRQADRRRRARRRSSSPRARPRATTSRSRASPSSTRTRATTSSPRVTEHKAVLDTCKRLEKEGFARHLPRASTRTAASIPTRSKRAITDKTILVSIMLANNEIGTVQPHRARSARSRASAACSSTRDAVQGVGKVAVRRRDDERRPRLDHRAQDVRPKGVGALYVRRSQAARAPRRADGRRRPRARHALGHAQRARHRRLRQGGRASCCKEGRPKNARILGAARAPAQAASRRRSTRCTLNGSLEHRLPGNLNVSFAFVEGEALMMAIKDVAVSCGSACTSASLEPSYVLRAMGVDEELAHSSHPLRPRPLQHRGRGRLRGRPRHRQGQASCARCRRSTRCTRRASTSSRSSGQRTDRRHRFQTQGTGEESSWRTATKSSNTTRTRATWARSTRTTRTSAPGSSARPRAAT